MRVTGVKPGSFSPCSFATATCTRKIKAHMSIFTFFMWPAMIGFHVPPFEAKSSWASFRMRLNESSSPFQMCLSLRTWRCFGVSGKYSWDLLQLIRGSMVSDGVMREDGSGCSSPCPPSVPVPESSGVGVEGKEEAKEGCLSAGFGFFLSDSSFSMLPILFLLFSAAVL
jgi:hypothetical protein